MAFTKKVVKAADAVVSPDMTQDQINDAVQAAAASENKVLEVQAGDYSNGENNHKKVIIDASGMTVLLKGGDYIRAQISLLYAFRITSADRLRNNNIRA